MIYFIIYKYCLNTRIIEIEKPLLNQIQELETKLLITEFGVEINKFSWELFKLPYALYVIKIENIYKIGTFGITQKICVKKD